MFDDRAYDTGICGPNPPRAPPDIPSPPVGPVQSPPTDSQSEGGEAGPSGVDKEEGEEKTKKTRRGKKKKKERSSARSDASSPVMGEPGSLPLMQEEGSQEEPPPISRTVSDTALVTLTAGAAGSSPDSGIEPGPSSPFSFSDLDLPSAPGGKQKIVLSAREVAQLRRSFEAAKARRAGFKHAKHEPQPPPARISSAKTSEFNLMSQIFYAFRSRWVFVCLALFLLFSYSYFRTFITQENSDKYHLLFQDEI